MCSVLEGLEARLAANSCIFALIASFAFALCLNLCLLTLVPFVEVGLVESGTYPFLEDRCTVALDVDDSVRMSIGLFNSEFMSKFWLTSSPSEELVLEFVLLPGETLVCNSLSSEGPALDDDLFWPDEFIIEGWLRVRAAVPELFTRLRFVDVCVSEGLLLGDLCSVGEASKGSGVNATIGLSSSDTLFEILSHSSYLADCVDLVSVVKSSSYVRWY
jgi:hypothetical protein